MHDHDKAQLPEMVKFAVTPNFEVGGSLFKPGQLALLGSIIGEDARIELTTFKQLYVEIHEDRIDEVTAQLKMTGLRIYPVGFYTKSLIACNFCKGAEAAGLSVAEMLDAAIAGLPVPSSMKIGYSGCALATGEPLLKDIGIVKMRDTFDIYVGGEGKTLKATLGQLFMSGAREDQLIPVVMELIQYFRDHAKKKESFSRFVQRVSIETLKEAVDRQIMQNDNEIKPA